MTTQEGIDPVLVERFAHGNGTVFVGAGISTGAGLPNWSQLMDPLRADLGAEAGSEANNLNIAELYQVKHSRSVLVQYLKDRLGDARFRLTNTHELIVELPVKRVYTTNFDDLLEQASYKKQINRNVVTNASHIGFSDRSALSIIKLHGDLSDPESIIISASDFYTYFARNPAVANLLKVELQTRTVLFLGYSFSDPNLAMLIANAATESGLVRPLLYSVQIDPSDLTMRAMNARGVKVIPLKNVGKGKAAKSRAVENWLRSFKQSLFAFERRKYHFAAQTKRTSAASPLTARKNAVRRVQVLERIRTGLQSDFRVVVVKGEAGIGKTQLVAEASAEFVRPPGTYMQEKTFEEIIWIRGTNDDGQGAYTLERIFDTIASHVDILLGSDGDNDIETKQSQIDMILQGRRLLVVIEDFEDPACRIDCRDGGTLTAVQLEARTRFLEIRKWLENAGLYANPRSRIIVTSRSAIIAGFVVEVAKMDEQEALELLQEHARSLARRWAGQQFIQGCEKKLLSLTTGNPQAIKWALGLCSCKGNVEPLEDLAEPVQGKDIMAIFEGLVAKIMEELANPQGDPEQSVQIKYIDVVTAMMVFPSEQWIASSLVEAALLSREHGASECNGLRSGLSRCVHIGLLEHDPASDSYLMHRTTREVLLCRSEVKQGRLDELRNQLSDYLLHFLRRHDVICRPSINEAYWNALVRDEMVKVDPYWPTIESLMRFWDGKKFYVDFALLLVHYMDSRFLNNQRLSLIEGAIKTLGSTDNDTSALLHIDALAWTFIEENNKKRAREEIEKGLALIKDRRPDLHALAHAWRARMYVDDGNNVKANDEIRLARKAATSSEVKARKPWILARVEMIAGDVKFMDGEPDAAVESYLASSKYANEYGGEGDGYQTSPRLGLALMAKTDKDGECLKEARLCFTKLVENGHVATGKLYGQYGLALIAARENSSRDAIRKLEQIISEIRSRSNGHVLLGLAEKSYQRIIEARAGTVPVSEQPTA